MNLVLFANAAKATFVFNIFFGGGFVQEETAVVPAQTMLSMWLLAAHHLPTKSK